MPLGKGLGSLIPTQKRGVIHKETRPPADRDTVWHIPLTEIFPNAEQPRKEFPPSELAELVESIKIHGVLQPVLVTELGDGGYELIAGERRLRAATLAGLPTIPAMVKAATRQEKLELALIENIQRQNLNPVEEAFAFKRLMEEFGLTQEEVAERVGKSRPAIANALRLLDLPEPIQKALIDGQLSVGKAKALLSLKSKEDQMRMFAELIGQRASVRDLEQKIAVSGASRKGFARRDPNIAAQEQLIQDRLGAPVSITQRGEQGTITISFYSKEEFTRLMRELT